MNHKPIQSVHHFQPTPSGIWRRMLAYQIDIMLLSIVSIVIVLVCIQQKHFDYIAICLLIGSAQFLYEWFTHAQWGGSIGKKITGIVVKNKNHEKLGYVRSAVRALAKTVFFLWAIPFLSFVPGLLLIISGFMIMFSDSKRTLHDRAAQTIALNTRSMSTFEGISIYFISWLVIMMFSVATLSLFGKVLQNSFQDFFSPDSPLFSELIEHVEQNSRQPHLSKNQLETIQYVDGHMYLDALQPVDVKHVSVDEETAQIFEYLVVVPERTGINEVKLHFYLPPIPNLLHYADAYQLHIDPIYGPDKKPTNFTFTQPEFTHKTENKISHYYASSTIAYKGLPVPEIRIDLSLKLPVGIRKTEILASEIKSSYTQYEEKVSHVSFYQQSMQFTISGALDTYLGILAYDEMGNIIAVQDEFIEDTASLSQVYDYNFAQAPYRTELFIAKSFFKMDIPAIIAMDSTYIKTHDNFFTFYPHPQKYLKKSIAEIHEIKTKKYDISIRDNELTINSLNFGKIKKNDWIHVQGKKIFLNGKMLN